MKPALERISAESIARVREVGVIGACAVAASVCSILLVIAGFTGGSIIAFAVLGLAALVAGLVLSGNPRLFCLWALLMTAPIDMSKKFVPIPHMGGASAFRIELVDVFIAALVGFLLRDLWFGRTRHLRFPRCFWWWVGMIGLGCLSAVIAQYRMIALLEVFRMTKCLLLALVLVNELVRVRQFAHALLALVLGVLMQCFIATLQYVLDRQLGLHVIGEATAEGVELLSKATLTGGARVNRVGALIGHANLLAAYLAMLLPIAVAVLFARVDLRVKMLCLACVVLGEAVLVATLSRTGWVDFGAAFLLVLALSHYHRRMRLRYVMVRVVIILAIGMVGLALSGPIMERLTRSDPGAWKFRLQWIDVAFRMVQDRPMLGFGLNSFVFSMVPYTPQGTPEELNLSFGDMWPVVHNIYMVTWAEQGTIGFLFFVLLHVHLTLIAARNLRIRNDLMFAIGSGCFCGFVAMAIDGMGSFALRMDHVARVFWMLVALMVAADYWRRANEDPIYRRSSADPGSKGASDVGRFVGGEAA